MSLAPKGSEMDAYKNAERPTLIARSSRLFPQPVKFLSASKSFFFLNICENLYLFIIIFFFGK